MSVHTLREDGGMVQIGATVTKAEALAAGPQILKFCFDVNDQKPPILLNRLHWHGADRTVYAVNGVRVHRDNRTIHLFDHVINATTARMLAQVLAEMAEDAANEPDTAEVERLTGFIPASVSPDVAREVATSILRRFKVEERAS